jgi:hypothetical protein
MAGQIERHDRRPAIRFASELFGSAERSSVPGEAIRLGHWNVETRYALRPDTLDFVQRAFLPASGDGRTFTLTIADGHTLPVLPNLDWASPWTTMHVPVPENHSYPYRIFADVYAGILYVWDTVAHRGLIWIRRGSELDFRVLVTPFRLMFSWMAHSKGGLVLHAGVGAVAKRGVLLSGPSGSGKSTTSISLGLFRGGLLADDCVLLEGSTAHAIYARGKVDESALTMMGRSSITTEVVPGFDNGKRMMNLSQLGDQFLETISVGAIVFPSRHRSSGVFPVSSASASNRLSLDSRRELFGGSVRDRILIAALCSSVPAFHLNLATSTSDVMQQCDSLIAQLDQVSEGVA